MTRVKACARLTAHDEAFTQVRPTSGLAVPDTSTIHSLTRKSMNRKAIPPPSLSVRHPSPSYTATERHCDENAEGRGAVWPEAMTARDHYGASEREDAKKAVAQADQALQASTEHSVDILHSGGVDNVGQSP